jgi:mRNA-degrading endonuclease YafQ of YafQ-DinJ toxin-antitoxin module
MKKSSPEYTAVYSPDFPKTFQKYSAIKVSIQKKVEQILQDPLGPQTEPLGHDLVGLRSAPVKKSFRLIFAVCEECRRLGHSAVNNCFDCASQPDNTVYFFTIGPHDDAYAIGKRLRQKGRMSS